MIDAMGREIRYMRLSVTDRCNLRCQYCMPNGVPSLPHDLILTYEEMLTVCETAATLGIDLIKVTGGEPLARKGCVDFIRRLKAVRGIRQVTMTTNGILLGDALAELKELSIDGINISLDSLDPATFRAVTGGDENTLPRVLDALERSVALGIPTKVNTVLTEAVMPTLPDVLALARRLPVDVRLIELMPIGEGKHIPPVPVGRALDLCLRLFPDLHPVAARRGNGPARYFEAKGLKGKIGLIDAVSHQFCARCNRIRLTATGLLKPCLCYREGTELRPLLRGGATPEELRAAMHSCIYHKPASHAFARPEGASENEPMNRIGG